MKEDKEQGEANPLTAVEMQRGVRAVTKYRCVYCGKLTSGRMPRLNGRHLGDTSERYPRRHDYEGKPCPGNIEHAEWVDIKP